MQVVYSHTPNMKIAAFLVLGLSSVAFATDSIENVGQLLDNAIQEAQKTTFVLQKELATIDETTQLKANESVSARVEKVLRLATAIQTAVRNSKNCTAQAKAEIEEIAKGLDDESKACIEDSSAQVRAVRNATIQPFKDAKADVEDLVLEINKCRSIPNPFKSSRCLSKLVPRIVDLPRKTASTIKSGLKDAKQQAEEALIEIKECVNVVAEAVEEDLFEVLRGLEGCLSDECANNQ